MTQENVADELNMTQQGYSKYETGERELKHSRLEAIAKVLGVSVEDVLAFDDKIIFSVHNNSNSNNGLVINQSTLAEKEREIYELKLRLQDEEIKSLKKQLEAFQSKTN